LIWSPFNRSYNIDATVTNLLAKEKEKERRKLNLSDPESTSEDVVKRFD